MMAGLRVLVCGGRKFSDAELLGSWLGGVRKQRGIAEIITGDATGADYMAARFAEWAHIPARVYRADWRKHGKAAGPIRNQRMLDHGKPDLVVAFKGGAGTADMIRRARTAGIPVLDTNSPESMATYEAALRVIARLEAATEGSRELDCNDRPPPRCPRPAGRCQDR